MTSIFTKRTFILLGSLLFSSLICTETEAQVVTLSLGNAGSASAPVNNSNPYSANEMIYLQSQINQAGTIYKVAFEKSGGASTTPISNVQIYMKHTTQSAFTAGAFDTTGYTRVFKGDFTNNATSGWMEVNLNTAFTYNNTDNLLILFFKNNGNTLTSHTYKYAFVGRLATRRTNNATGITTATNLTTSDALPNLRLDFSNPVGIAKNEALKNLSVYPNPVKDVLAIQGMETSGTLSFMDITGRLIESVNMKTGENNISVSHLTPGIYIAKLNSGKTVHTTKFIKE